VTGNGGVTAVTYHPVRYELAVGYESGAVRVFDVATTALLRDARQHGGPVLGLGFSPEGARLFSAGADGAVVVVDAARVRVRCVGGTVVGELGLLVGNDS